MKGELFKYQMTKPCLVCGTLYSNLKFSTHSDWEKSKYCSHKCFCKSSDFVLPDCFKKGISHTNNTGIKRSIEVKKKLSDLHKTSELCKKNYFKIGIDNPSYGRNQTGSNNANWRGGSLAPNQIIRNSPKYDEFRLACLRRDHFTCTDCGATGYLHVHHIKELSLFPELAYDINNGKTVCEGCHEKIHGRPIKIRRKYINTNLIVEKL